MQIFEVERLENYHSHFGELYATLDRKVSDETARATSHLEALTSQQSGAFAEKHATLVERIDSEHAHFADERGRQLGEHVVRYDDVGEGALWAFTEQILGPAVSVHPLVNLASLH